VPCAATAWSRVANATSPEKDDAGGKGVTTGVAKGSPPTPSVVGAGGATPAAAGGKPRLDWGMGAVSAGFVPSYSAEAASSPQTASAVAVLPGESPGAPAPAAVGGGTADAAPTQPPTLQKRGSRRLGWGMGIGSKLSADEKATEAAAALAAEKAAAEKAEADKAAAAKKAADEAAAAAAVAAAPPKALEVAPADQSNATSAVSDLATADAVQDGAVKKSAAAKKPAAAAAAAAATAGKEDSSARGASADGAAASLPPSSSSSGVDQTAAASPPTPMATGATPKTPGEAAGRRKKDGGAAAASAGSAGSLKRRPPQQPRDEDVASGGKGTATTTSPALSPPPAVVSPRTLSSSTPPSADATTGGARKAMKEFGNAANSAVDGGSGGVRRRRERGSGEIRVVGSGVGGKEQQQRMKRAGSDSGKKAKEGLAPGPQKRASSDGIVEGSPTKTGQCAAAAAAAAASGSPKTPQPPAPCPRKRENDGPATAATTAGGSSKDQRRRERERLMHMSERRNKKSGGGGGGAGGSEDHPVADVDLKRVGEETARRGGDGRASAPNGGHHGKEKRPRRSADAADSGVKTPEAPAAPTSKEGHAKAADGGSALMTAVAGAAATGGAGAAGGRAKETSRAAARQCNPSGTELRRLTSGTEVEERRTLAALRDLEACLEESRIAAADAASTPVAEAERTLVVANASASQAKTGEANNPGTEKIIASSSSSSSANDDGGTLTPAVAAAVAALPAELATALGLAEGDGKRGEGGGSNQPTVAGAGAGGVGLDHEERNGFSPPHVDLVRQARATVEFRVARRRYKGELKIAAAAASLACGSLPSPPVEKAAGAAAAAAATRSEHGGPDEASAERLRGPSQSPPGVVTTEPSAASAAARKGPSGLRTRVPTGAPVSHLFRARVDAAPGGVPKSGRDVAIARVMRENQARALRRRWEKLGDQYAGLHNAWHVDMLRWEEKMEEEEAKEAASASGGAGEGDDGDAAWGPVGGGGGGGGGSGSGGGHGASLRSERRGGRRLSDVVRSDYEEAEVVKKFEDKHKEEERIRKGAVEVPSMLTAVERRQLPEYRDSWNSRGTTDGLPARCRGLPADAACPAGCNCPAAVEAKRKLSNLWTDVEKCIFLDKFLHHPKNFMRIASFLPRKSPEDVVQFYYDSKTSIDYKTLLKEAVNRNKGYAGQWNATFKAIRSVGAKVSIDEDGQPFFPVPQRDDSFATADMHPPSRTRPLLDIQREALSLACSGEVVGAAAAAAKTQVSEALLRRSAAAEAVGAGIPQQRHESPTEGLDLLSPAEVKAAAARLPPAAINVAAYRLCMRSFPPPDDGDGDGGGVIYAARDVAAAAGGAGSGAGRFDEGAIMPYRFSDARVTGVPHELAPPRSASATAAAAAAAVAGGIAGDGVDAPYEPDGLSGGGGGGIRALHDGGRGGRGGRRMGGPGSQSSSAYLAAAAARAVGEEANGNDDEYGDDEFQGRGGAGRGLGRRGGMSPGGEGGAGRGGKAKRGAPRRKSVVAGGQEDGGGGGSTLGSAAGAQQRPISTKGAKWTEEEREAFFSIHDARPGNKEWERYAELIHTKTPTQVKTFYTNSKNKNLLEAEAITVRKDNLNRRDRQTAEVSAI
ncbi:unnamed protein product, partial [Ectocarpus fasciculatus]